MRLSIAAALREPSSSWWKSLEILRGDAPPTTTLLTFSLLFIVRISGLPWIFKPSQSFYTLQQVL